MTHIFTVLLFIISVSICIFGPVRYVTNYMNQRKGVKRFVSGIPFVGPLLFFVAWFSSGYAYTHYLLLIFVVEIDTVLTSMGIFYMGTMHLLGNEIETQQSKNNWW